MSLHETFYTFHCINIVGDESDTEEREKVLGIKRRKREREKNE